MRTYTERMRVAGLRVVLCAVIAANGTAAATAAAAGLQEVDVTGTGMWQFVVELGVGTGEPTFVFEQDGETVTGTYDGFLGTAEVTGTVEGDRIEFRFGGAVGEAVFVGAIDGETMKGTCDYGGVTQGTWEAERQ